MNTEYFGKTHYYVLEQKKVYQIINHEIFGYTQLFSLSANKFALKYQTRITHFLIHSLGKDSCGGDSGGPLTVEENGRFEFDAIS